jgi:hypothetical protein
MCGRRRLLDRTVVRREGRFGQHQPDGGHQRRQRKKSKPLLIDVQNHVEPGRYVVGFKHVQPGGGGDRNVNAIFYIVEGQHQGVHIARYYTLPMRGLRPSQTSKLGTDFFSLVGQRPPQNLKPEDFLAGVHVEVEVIDVDHDRNRKKKPIELVYSKINSMVRIVAGTPKVLQR